MRATGLCSPTAGLHLSVSGRLRHTPRADVRYYATNFQYLQYVPHLAKNGCCPSTPRWTMPRRWVVPPALASLSELLSPAGRTASAATARAAWGPRDNIGTPGQPVRRETFAWSNRLELIFPVPEKWRSGPPG